MYYKYYYGATGRGIFDLIEIVWTIKPSRFWLNIIPGPSLLLTALSPLSTLRIGPVVPQIVAISTVPSIPSKLQNEKKWNRIEKAIFYISAMV